MKDIILIISLILSFNSIACHNSTINSVSSVLNGDGSRTFTINVSIDVGSSDGYSYGFALLFSNTSATAPSITNISSGNITKSGYNPLRPYYGGTIGSGGASPYFNSRYNGRADVLTYESNDGAWGFGSTDYNNQTVVVTLSGCVETITLDADIRSMTTSASAVGACVKTFATGLTCCTPPNTPTTNSVAASCSSAEVTSISNYSASNTYTFTPSGPTVGPSGTINGMTVATNYQVTASNGGCSSTASVAFSNDAQLTAVTPTFTQVSSICSGGSFTLPTMSNNSIGGSWSPAANNTSTTLYTFTPTAGQCATTATMTVTVNSAITPTFNAVGPYCSGATIPALATTSTNAINGTWSPAINNTTTTLYTFTPSAGQCATTTTLTITITPPTTPTFNAVGPYCSGATIPALATTSTNAINGTWSPAINNTTTTLYTFTPTAGQCATTTTLTITITPPTTPTFNAVGPYCSGATIPALATTSTNAINGTWSPAINNTTTTLYTFTPTAGQCATTTTLTITITPPTTPTFNAVGPYCSGATIPALATTSTNAINGTWSPAINNTTTTLYTFTPTAGQCATTTTLTITITSPTTPTFNAVGPYCSGATIPALATTSTNAINGTWSPAINNTTTTLYTFTPTAGQCATTTTLTITITSPTTPTFNAVGPYCSGATIPALATTSTNTINGTWSPAINNTTTTLYTFTPTAGQCATTTTLTVTIPPIETATFTMTPTCTGGTATVTGTTGGTFVFTVAPSDAAVINSSTGTITGGTSGATYQITYTTPGICSASSNQSVTASNSDNPTFSMTPNCTGGNATISGTTGGTFTFTVAPSDAAIINAATGAITNGTAGSTYQVTYATSGACAASSNLSVTASNSDNPTFTMTPTCDGGSASITGTTGGSFTFTVAPSDAAIINAGTGSVTGGTSGSTYQVTYATSGACAASSNQSVTALSSDNPTFTTTPTCDGGTAAVSGTAGGTFTFAIAPSDAAIINAGTGTITGGSSGATYQITYTTSGTCVATSNQSVTALNLEDPTFSMTPTCDGGTAAITGITGGAFTFTVAPIDAAIINAGTGTITGGTSGSSYQVTYTTPGACSANSNQTVTASNSDDPSFSMTPNCVGGTATITGTTGGTFTFTVAPIDGALINGASGTITGGTSGTTYQVTYATSGACAASSNQSVTASNSDDATFTMTATCDGGTSSISGTTGGTFTFTTAPTDAAIINAVTGTVSGGTSGSTYQVTYSTSGTCAASSNQSVTALTVDNPTFSTTPTCDGGTASVSGTIGGIFTFTVPPADAAIINSGTGTVTGGNSGATYQITYTTSGVCPASSNQNLVALLTPTITAHPQNISICASSATTFSVTATNAINYQWEMRPTNNGTFATLNDIGVYSGTTTSTLVISNCTGLNGLEFRVVVSDASGNCSTTSNNAVLTVNVIETPVITCGTSTVNSVQFNWNAPTGATNYAISYTINGGPSQNGGSVNTPTYTVSNLNPLDAVIITIITTGSTSCYANASATCSAQPCVSPTINSHPTIQSACAGLTANFSVNATGATAYQWEVSTNGGGVFSPLSNNGVYSGVTSNTLNISNNTGLNSNQYRVVISEINSLCPTTSNSALITVYTIPTISGTLTACPTETTQLSGSTTAANLSPWLSSNNNIATIDNNGLITGISNGTTTITFTDNNGCSQTATVSIPAATSPFISCGTNTTSSTTFTWTSPIGATDYDITYSINGGAIQVAGNQSTNSYTVNGLSVDDQVDITITTNGSGCYQLATQTCFAASCIPSIASFLPDPKTITSQNPVTNFINSSSNAVSYYWDFGDGTSSVATSPSHQYTIDESTNYDVTLIVYNTDGCNDTVVQTVIVTEELIYYVPNSFTPNGDDFNNVFYPVFYSGHDPYSYSMYIFNRWGEIVFETHDISKGWNGTYGSSDKIAQDGVYTWKIEFKEKGIDKKNQVTGHVILSR